ncbi:histidine kinase [Streptomyces sp. 549]|uniref:sensor histidine kinase n=1 Tax=Streptomyces sp. 549 TaxID=3049076 RepID=UPI0024C3DBE8|nr:histidine kinase [Streptomyces sp. 549]MDK1474842.1 histidine kinase [Streptomyces sp. 549]
MPQRLTRPHRDDLLIAAAGLVFGLALWSMDLYTKGQGHDVAESEPLVLLALAVMCVAVALRRSANVWVVLVATAALVLDLWAGSLLATLLLYTDVVYAAVLYGSVRLSRTVVRVSVFATAGVTALAFALLQQPSAVLLGAVFGFLTVAPATTGLLVRGHRDTAAAERLRAERTALRAEQTALLAEMDRAQAVTAERARMARELHDVVANHLSAIALHATAAQSLEDAEATGQALVVIRENSVQGLTEMRRLIGILREAGADGAPAAVATLDGLASLVKQARVNGSPGGLRFTLEDTHAGGAALPSPVDLAAYRTVQESLTNAVKHAAPGEVAVRVARQDGVLLVEVASALGERAAPGVPGSGAGLVGMRERLALLGGAFEAGPQDGRWMVRAVFPLDEGE